MARRLVLTLALVLSTLALADRFVCPDGCTEGARASFDCVLCHGFEFTAVPLPSIPADRIARHRPSGVVIPSSPVPPSIEHPPRA